jgi:hypothetical protein
LEAVFVLVQDRGMVCAKMYHRLRNHFLDAPTSTLGDEAQVEARFGLFGDSANLD